MMIKATHEQGGGLPIGGVILELGQLPAPPQRDQLRRLSSTKVGIPLRSVVIEVSSTEKHTNGIRVGGHDQRVSGVNQI